MRLFLNFSSQFFFFFGRRNPSDVLLYFAPFLKCLNDVTLVWFVPQPQHGHEVLFPSNVGCKHGVPATVPRLRSLTATTHAEGEWNVWVFEGKRFRFGCWCKNVSHWGPPPFFLTRSLLILHHTHRESVRSWAVARLAHWHG